MPTESAESPIFQENETPTTPDTQPRQPDGKFAPKSALNPQLKRQAQELGLDDDELTSMSESEVRAYVREEKRDRVWNQRMEQQLAMAQRARDGVREPTAPVDDVDWGKSEDGTPFTENDYLPPIREAAKAAKQIKDLEKRVAALEGNVGGITRYHQQQVQQQQESFTRRFDKAVGKHPHIFGTGPISKLDTESPEFDFRIAAFKAYKKAGANPDDLEDIVGQFAAKRFRGASSDPEDRQEQEDEEIRRWEAGVLARPTQRGNVPEPPSKEKATQAVKDRLRNITRSPVNGTDKSEFLG